jgi:hypothetical protein
LRDNSTILYISFEKKIGSMAKLAPPRRHGTPITSPRHIALRHARRVVQLKKAGGIQTNVEDNLKPGWERLFSYEVPGLQAGTYKIEAEQVIESNEYSDDSSTISKTTPQLFRVLGPRFSLPPDAIYSFYPPSGHLETHDVLPHVVFNDQMMPWERPMFKIVDGLSQVPWLALLVFTPTELTIDDAELKKIFKGTSIAESVKQNQTLAVEMPVEDLKNLKDDDVARPVKDTAEAVTKNMNILLVPQSVFNPIFSKYNPQGNSESTPNPYVDRYRYLAHQRHINVEGMANADDDQNETTRRFSVVVANRLGPLSESKATPVVVHLVSLEGINNLSPFPVPQNHVAMISLHSWTYSVLPAGTLNVPDAFDNLANNARMLRPDIAGFRPATASDAVGDRVLQRVKDGYTLVRYMVPSGEETVALFRGPFVPICPLKPDWKLLSTTGTDLHILDPELGILDITYSSAWQLGRTLALADRAFATALTRIRREILIQGKEKSQVKFLKATGIPWKSKLDLAASLKESMKELLTSSSMDETGAGETESCQQRWERPAHDSIDLRHTSHGVSHFLHESLRDASRLIASADNGVHDPELVTPYNEVNVPKSVDWMVVFKFVLDLFHLHNVPPHYLFNDPSHIPPESLRFFLLDQSWVDALVDGALSLGNHMEQSTDNVRQHIKDRIKDYMESKDPDFGYYPPMPRFGFIVRSEVVQKFPDLKVEVISDQKSSASSKANANPMEPPTLVSSSILDDGLLIGLLTDKALTIDKPVLCLTVLGHQQYFSAAATITSQKLKMKYKRIYTNPLDPESVRPEPIAQPEWTRSEEHPEKKPVPFVWGTTDRTEDVRILLVEHLADDLFKTLGTEMNKTQKQFDEKEASAAMIGIQLNSPSWQLRAKIAPLPIPCQPPTLSNADVPVRTKTLQVNQLPEKIAMARAPTLAEREACAPLLEKGIPPHHRGVIPAESLDRILSYNQSRPNRWLRSDSQTSFVLLETPDLEPPLERPFSEPTLIFRVWPITNPKVSKVVSDTTVDLILSILVKPGTASSFAMERATISFYAGSKDYSSLTDEYRGSSASMISNLRFTVRTTYRSETKEMQLVILPRSVTLSCSKRAPCVPMEKVQEMSVFLPAVKVKKVTGTTKVQFTLNPTYHIGNSTKVPAVLEINNS